MSDDKITKKISSNNDDPQWMSVHEVSDYLHIKEASIYRWLREKHIPAYKIGRYWRFDKREINKWIKSGKAAGIDSFEDPED